MFGHAELTGAALAAPHRIGVGVEAEPETGAPFHLPRAVQHQQPCRATPVATRSSSLRNASRCIDGCWWRSRSPCIMWFTQAREKARKWAGSTSRTTLRKGCCSQSASRCARSSGRTAVWRELEGIDLVALACPVRFDECRRDEHELHQSPKALPTSSQKIDHVSPRPTASRRRSISACQAASTAGVAD